MKNSKLNFYFFGDIGEYDEYNPAFVLSEDYSSEILYLIAESKSFSISKFQLSNDLNIKEEAVENIIKKLQFINAIEVKNDRYRIKFPVFLEADIIKIQPYIKNIGKIIGDKIIFLKDILYKNISELESYKYYDFERLLYHIICDYIFDGSAFDFFEERNTIAVSKIQPGDRDYIIIAYEDSEILDKHSNNLLCSSNNYKCEGFTFNSFGDANGLRKDMFRFFRIVEKEINNITDFKGLNGAYNKILDEKNKNIAKECGKLIYKVINNEIKYNDLNNNERNIVGFLKELEYIQINDDTIFVNVPVFYKVEIETIIKNISDIILTNIFPIIKRVFDEFESEKLDLTSIRHGVDIKEVGNELWHQIFGATNEYLVEEGFVLAPENIKGEGRYLRSIEINIEN